MINCLPFVSIVVIGMNEESNLHDIFQAVKNLDYPQDRTELIYVDSGSTDKSIEIAQKYTQKIFVEKSMWPTPGLARNRGIVEAKYDIIHFLDGDIQLQRDYLKKAVNRLAQGDIQAVYGYLTEKSQKGFNKVLLSRWHDKKSGFSPATGGGGTYLKKPLFEVDGYDERIKKGQETDLGERLTAKGYRIWLLDELMGTHDYGIKTVYEVFNRHVIFGRSSAYILFLPEKSKYMKVVSRRCLKDLTYFALFLVLFTVSILFERFGFLLVSTAILFLLVFTFKYRKFFIKRDFHRVLDWMFIYISFPFRVFGIFQSFVFILLNKIKGVNVLKKKDRLNINKNAI